MGMRAVDLVVFLLVSWGAVYLVTESVIFTLPRILLATRSRFAEAFLYCASCTGFWIGAVVYALSDPVTFDPLHTFFAGLLVMGSVTAVRAVQPDFLPGAHDREHEIIEDRREQRADR